MIGVIELYQMWALDDANKDENGYASFEKFNRYLKRALIDLPKQLTGFLNGKESLYPRAFETQKVKDYLKDLITRHIGFNSFEIPKDYFHYDNMYKLGGKRETLNCESDEVVFKDGCDIAIEILDGQQFKSRCGSYIKGIKPTSKNPICKIVNNRFEFEPKELGAVVLEYIRYPKEAKIVVKKNPVLNIDEADEVNSANIELGEWAIEPLLFFMNDRYAMHTRERALKESNLTNKETTMV